MIRQKQMNIKKRIANYSPCHWWIFYIINITVWRAVINMCDIVELQFKEEATGKNRNIIGL